jgi:3'-phosphoadenosine 5'-phosphosulfate sulfotransferase (PAPS reductase)/FAD synthetase
MALRLAEVAPRDYLYVCTPTGDELPEMWAHWRKLGELLGKPIIPVMGGTLDGLIEQFNALPNWRQRWCTRLLKIEPYAAWLQEQARTHERIISYVGIRYDEPEREAGDYTNIPNAEMHFPLREWEWDINDVLGYLEQRDVTIPARTDCARCFFQTLGEWWNLWREHPEAYTDAEAQEAKIGHTFRSPGRDTWPAGLKELREEFEKGRTPRGAAQMDMLAAMKCRVCRI